MKLRYLFILGFLAVVQSVVYDLFFMNNPTKAPDIESRIESIYKEAEDITAEWFACVDADAYAKKLFSEPLPDQWRNHGISIYLYQGDELCCWFNHIFRYEVDSIISMHPASIEQFDGNTVLSFRSSQGDRRAIITITLVARVDWFNDYVFPDEAHYPQFFAKMPVSTAPDRQVDQISVLGRKFFVEVSATRQMPLVVNLVGWLGIVLLLWSLKQFVRRGVTSRNAIQRLGLMSLVLLVFRLTINYIDIPNGGSFSWSSLGSLLVTYGFILMLMAEAYSMRFRLRAQVRAMTMALQYVVLFVTLLFMVAVIVFFHYSMVELIRVNTANVEIYNIFSLNFDSIVFYVVCAVFVAMRMLYSRVTEAVLSQFPYWARAAMSVVMLIIVVVPLESRIVNTGFILVMFHVIFLAVYYLSRWQFVGRQFVYDLAVFTAYITFFSVIETFAARMATAKDYATQIASRTNWEQVNHDQPPKSLWFAIVKADNLVISENNNYELQPLLAVVSHSVDTIVDSNGITHIIRHRQSDDGATIVVSFERPTFVRIFSLWSYIFLWLLVVSGAILQVCELKVYRQYSHRSMLYRVRTMIFLIVIFSMGVVAVVVYQYSDEAYRLQQKNALKVSVQELRSNFTVFAEADSSDYRVMRRWLKLSNSSRTSLISLFDTVGVRIGGVDDALFLSRMNSEAYGALRYRRLPYFERLDNSRSKEYSIAYTPLYWHSKLVGYMSVVHLNPQNTYRKFALLSSIFNVFIIVLLISVFVSLMLYSAITKPLNILYEGLSGVKSLKKIQLAPSLRLDDEIGTIITQYNSMIDYLEESYLALARSEREGAWREMARQVAHEIKNPLTPMRLKIQMLQRARAQGMANCTEQLDSTLVVLLEQIDILNRIATEFSDLARLPQGAIVRIELSGLLTNAVGLYSSNECVSVRLVDLTERKVYVNVDYASMSRVVVNLLQNATQAIVGSGEVRVTLYTSGKYAVVEVQDNGTGISDDVMVKMFEPNFTTKSRGNGLGLAICRQIVENFSGTISAANAEGGGAVFTVMLPLA